MTNRVIVELDGSMHHPHMHRTLTLGEAMDYEWAFRLPDGSLHVPEECAAIEFDEVRPCIAV